MKKLTSKFLLLCMMLLATASVSAAPDYDFKYDGLCYYIISEEDRTVEVAPLDRNSGIANSNYVKGNLIIPERIIYGGKTYKVTSIGNHAFVMCFDLTSVEIPNSVTSIGGSAFSDCDGLTSVEIPNSVTSIGDGAFGYCDGLISVEIPNSVTSIGYFAFSSCDGLTSIEIPNSVTSIGDGAFADCSGLMEIKVAESNPNYVSIDGCLYSKDVTTLCCCPGAKTSITIPNSVTEISKYAFRGCSGLTSVEIPNTVTEIADYVFWGCSGLTSIEIPNSVTSIGYYAFIECSGLMSLTLGSSVTSIDYEAFRGCSGLKEVYCKMETPVETNTAFSDEAYMNATLYVPEGCKEAYEKVDPWRNFWTIEEFDATGISGVTVSGGQFVTVDGGTIKVDNADGQTVNVYDAAGTLVKSVKAGSGSVEIAVPGSGVYIVKVGGKAVKIAM